jgi:hypothetical protein
MCLPTGNGTFKLLVPLGSVDSTICGQSVDSASP